VSLALGLVAFCGGTWLLVESVEGLVRTLRGWATAAGLSGLVLAALVLGFDLESTAAGVAATLKDLPGTTLGTSIGATLFLLTAGLGIAALVAPFEVRVPRVALAAAAIATVLPLVLLADGRLSRLDGAVLLMAFLPLAAALLRARRAGPVADTAGEPSRRVPLRLLAALGGLLVGAELLVVGTQRVVGELGVSETLFGLLIVAVAVSLEEIVLEALPAYRGFPEFAVGNALGTAIFLLTASLGAIALVHPLSVPDPVRDYHAPALALASAVALALLARGRMGRSAGALLVLFYAAYAALATVLGG
jgi:cation:H+ antiporter